MSNIKSKEWRETNSKPPKINQLENYMINWTPGTKTFSTNAIKERKKVFNQPKIAQINPRSESNPSPPKLKEIPTISLLNLEEALFSQESNEYRVAYLYYRKTHQNLNKWQALSAFWNEGLRPINGKIVKKSPNNPYLK